MKTKVCPQSFFDSAYLGLRIGVAALLAAIVVASGCDSPPAYFRANLVRYEQEKLSDRAIEATYEPDPDDPESATEERNRITEEIEEARLNRQAIADALLALFGEPDSPNGISGLPDTDDPAPTPLELMGFDIQKLAVAAGPVYEDANGIQHGLYRLHCAHCHGITGGGDGTTAPFVNPYPRDYRPGVFKFKSTAGDAKPTREDLKRILLEGVPGTSMPSFALLPDTELEALIEYVIYLSVRGETEIELIKYVASEGEVPAITTIAGSLPLALDEDGIPEEEPDSENIVASKLYKWANAPSQFINPPEPKVDATDHAQFAASVERGRKLFYSANLKCSACHGDGALGDGQVNDFNYWFQWRKDLENSPPDVIEKRVEEFMAVGALRPRNAKPRNLRLGVFRGGRRPIDIYRRIYSGINGTPMPSQASAATPDQIWDLVNYALSLQYEPLSRGPVEVEGPHTTLR